MGQRLRSECRRRVGSTATKAVKARRNRLRKKWRNKLNGQWRASTWHNRMAVAMLDKMMRG